MTAEEIAAKAAADKAEADKAAADDAAKKAAETKEPEKKAGELSTTDAEAKAKAEAALVEIKKQNKALSKQVEALTKKIEGGDATKEEISSDLSDIYESYPEVDKKFINMILAKAKAAVADQIKPLTEKERAQEIDVKFQKNFKIAMDKLGKDFDGIVNADVIKELTQLAKNSDKTFSQIIEETYGGALTGKRTIETTKPGGGKEPSPLNFEKARKDGKYFDEVMSDPKLKAEYNAEMLKRGF